MSDKTKEIMERWKKRIPKPDFVRANDFKRVLGANYIIRRNEFSQAMYVQGKAHRKLSTKVEVDHALKMGKKVAQWGSKYFLYANVTPDQARPILEVIWKEDKRRGIPIPEFSAYDKEQFDI